MIFEVTPAQIQALDSGGLAELLRRLLHAEAKKAGISLRAVSAPLQITISDDGEDARVSWQGGKDKTDYCPARFSLFQSKASRLKPSDWKKEMWTRRSRRKGVTRKLNAAAKKVLAEKGAYVGFTTATLVGTTRYDDSLAAIRQGILDAGGDPSLLAAVEIYDANRIAAWASTHPSVAVWLNELQSGLNLGGFQTIESWGKKADFESIAAVDDEAPRYVLGGRQVMGSSGAAPVKNTLTSQQAKERISDYLSEPQAVVRLAGPSGLGKSRFAYELLRDVSTLAKKASALSAVYCDYRNVGQSLLAVTNTLATVGADVLLIVDECPREVAVQLFEMARRAGSQLSVLSIDVDDRPIGADGCLDIGIARSDDALVEGILRQRLPNARPYEIAHIKEFCGGFPRIAVLASANKHTHVLKSVGDVVEKVLLGCGITEDNALRAVESLALFEKLGADGAFSASFDAVAEQIAGMPGDRMYEHIAAAAQHAIVGRRGRLFQVQPDPIAAVLGARRLELLRASTLVRYITGASPEGRLALLSQWRLFDTSRTAVAVGEQLLGPDGLLGSVDNLNTDDGAECLHALVHVVPDNAADALGRVFGQMSVDELQEVRAGRRGVVSALAKLVFRGKSFARSAPLLMRLAAAENEQWANNATGHWQQLFYLHLSGTEVAPGERFSVLDAGIVTGDERIIRVCLGALDNTLSSGTTSRTSGAERIGTAPPLRDWTPKTWGDVFAFRRMGLKRLADLRAAHPEFSADIDHIIASSIRGLINPNLIDDLTATIDSIVAQKGQWLEAIEAVGDWLYFDRTGAPAEFSAKVRSLYDRLLPADLVQKALLYTRFWSGDIRDPDVTYEKENADSHDFEYSTRKAREVAVEIAEDPAVTLRAVEAMVPQQLHNAFPFAEELGLRAPDPIGVFTAAVSALKEASGLQFIRGLLSGVDQRDRALADQCARLALESPMLKGHAVPIYTALRVSPERLAEVLAGLKGGQVAPQDCVVLSYGRHLEPLAPDQVLPLVSELSGKHGAAGLWAAIEIASMYQLSRAEVSTAIRDFAAGTFTSPHLLETSARATREGHLLERMVAIVTKGGGLDDAFASVLTQFAVRLCQVSDFNIFMALDEPVRKVLADLVKEKPLPVWETLSRFYEVASSAERRKLIDLVGPSKFGFDGLDSTKAGILQAVPQDHTFGWADSDPAARAPFLAAFCPLLKKVGEGWEWHEATEQLIGRFGRVPEVRGTIDHRIQPSSWSGSLVPLFEMFLAPLKAWFTHSIGEVAVWARHVHGNLERQIAKERERDEEEG